MAVDVLTKAYPCSDSTYNTIPLPSGKTDPKTGTGGELEVWIINLEGQYDLDM